MKKTLGGERLGSGKKMEVDMHNYSRSTHDLGYIWRSTLSAGTLVPFMSKVALPGDTFDINLDCDIKTHPTIGPLFGSYKVQLDVFLAPIRLYQGKLHNNKLGIGMNMSQIKLPFIRLAAPNVDINTIEDLDNAQINPSSIFAYLGLRGVGIGDGAAPNQNRDFNGVSWLAYWDIYKNYYANKQEEIGAVVHTPVETPVNNVTSVTINTVPLVQAPALTTQLLDQASDTILLNLSAAQDLNAIVFNTSIGPITAANIGTVTVQTSSAVVIQYGQQQWGQITVYNWDAIDNSQTPIREIQIATFPLENIDTMRESIMAFTQNANAFNIRSTNLEPYSLIFDTADEYFSMKQSQEGLAIKTYQSDLFNNWLQTEWIDGVDGISAVTAIDTSGGSFTIDTLNLSKKVYDMLNRIAVSGGSYDDWLDAVYTHERYTRCESPMYMGGLIKELVFQEVVSNAESDTTSGGQPLGTLAGKGIMGRKHKGGNITIKVDEPGYIIGIISLTPRIDYSQGNEWDLGLMTMDDLHKPALDEIGFQELITERMAWWDTFQNVDGTWQQRSAGKQPAWINYMTDINKVYGNFAIKSNEMFMTLNRQYQAEIDGDHLKIEDLTTYIDPAKYNNIFAQTSLDSQNFWGQIAVDITARRKISAKLMPNL